MSKTNNGKYQLVSSCSCLKPKYYLATINGWRIYEKQRYWFVSKLKLNNVIHKWINPFSTKGDAQ